MSDPNLYDGPGGGIDSAVDGAVDIEPKGAAVVGATARAERAYEASLWGDAWRQLRRNPLFVGSVAFLLFFLGMALWPRAFSNWRIAVLGLIAFALTTALLVMAPVERLARRHRILAWVIRLLPIAIWIVVAFPAKGVDPKFSDLALTVKPPSFEHPFGYDPLGRDYYARVVYGTRVSVSIGVLVILFDFLIAVVMGCIAGFYAGKWDSFFSRTADIFFALPITLAGIVFLNVVGSRGLASVSFVLIFLGWTTLFRLMRASVLAGKEQDYVQAARALGASDWRIVRVHIIPNGIAPVIVYAMISLGIIISAEAALTFLGVGLQLPAISWGIMISEAQGRLQTSPQLLAFPALYLSVLVLVFIIMGDALRDALDPRLR